MLAKRSLRPSAAAGLLEQQPPAAIEALALTAAAPLAAERARRYLHEWRFVRSRLNGRDVVALGVPEGPQVGRALALLRAERLDGGLRSREEEEALVREMMRSGRRRAEVRSG
jgi:tRNA nucleotidyltransferase (CCA-adding enzyme)